MTARSIVVGAALVLSLALAGRALLTRQPSAPRSVGRRAFRLDVGQGATAKLWAVGDGADGGVAARRLARLIATARPDGVLYLGDVYERGSAAQFRDNFAAVYGRLVRRMFPTPGNHDWPAHEVGYDPYWRTVTGAPTPPWYSFRAGPWRVVSLNSEAPHDAGSAQAAFAREQLGGEGTCRLVFWHRPRFSAGSHGDQRDMEPLWRLARGHTALVLNGHDHNLQRMRPRDGTVELVTGAGGRGHYSLDRSDQRLAFADDTHFGAVRLTLAPGRAEAAFVAADGRVLDRTVVACRE